VLAGVRGAVMDVLPDEFRSWQNQVQYVKQRSPSKWTSSCPECGGVPHAERHNEWPDRCVWFLDSKPLGWCHQCGKLFFPDGTSRLPGRQERRSLRKRTHAPLYEESEEQTRRVGAFQKTALWERYHASMGEEGERYWRSRGIPPSKQAWWRLGYGTHPRYGEVASIPLFDRNFSRCLNIKYRLKVPDKGKYRYELSNGSNPPFLCDPEKPLDGRVIVVEGEIKAMVVHTTLDNPDEAVVGIPGITPGLRTISALDNAQEITLVADPGAEQQAKRLCEQLDESRCRLLVTLEKIDDAILAVRPDKYVLRRWLEQARRLI